MPTLCTARLLRARHGLRPLLRHSRSAPGLPRPNRLEARLCLAGLFPFAAGPRLIPVRVDARQSAARRY